jgi:hypothetical protein
MCEYCYLIFVPILWESIWIYGYLIIIIIIIIFLHGLGRLTRSGINALPSFHGASTISSSSRFIVECVFRVSGVVHSFKMVDPVLQMSAFGKLKFYAK